MIYSEVWRQLAQVYEEGEAKAIARLVYEKRYGLSLTDILLGKDKQLSLEKQEELQEIVGRLLKQEPVQYVLGETEFMGRRFLVAPGVLIPRPETEELCRHANPKEGLEMNGKGENLSILDVGTGSGCIAITLAAELPEAKVTAWDISERALEIAKGNAQRLGVDVFFAKVDVLQLSSFPQASHTLTSSSMNSPFDIIVSNPPYITEKENAQMERNVLDYEPHMALFVPDDDPLLFYRAIARLGLTALKNGGRLFFEINPLFAHELQELLRTMSYHDIHLYEDQYGKQRILTARR